MVFYIPHAVWSGLVAAGSALTVAFFTSKEQNKRHKEMIEENRSLKNLEITNEIREHKEIRERALLEELYVLIAELEKYHRKITEKMDEARSKEVDIEISDLVTEEERCENDENITRIKLIYDLYFPEMKEHIMELYKALEIRKYVGVKDKNGFPLGIDILEARKKANNAISDFMSRLPQRELFDLEPEKRGIK